MSLFRTFLPAFAQTENASCPLSAFPTFRISENKEIQPGNNRLVFGNSRPCSCKFSKDGNDSQVFFAGLFSKLQFHIGLL